MLFKSALVTSDNLGRLCIGFGGGARVEPRPPRDLSGRKPATCGGGIPHVRSPEGKGYNVEMTLSELILNDQCLQQYTESSYYVKPIPFLLYALGLPVCDSITP